VVPCSAEELDPRQETVVYGHHGVRSATAEWLRQLGFPAVNLRGGIDAWTLAVDPSLRRH
jgi:rhodanese-related sulfurtransferase